ncbi:MAG: GNAT family protein [Pseudomonadota bacterium]|nr:GNAT family protein [Pseudomonadota bacterium]
MDTTKPPRPESGTPATSRPAPARPHSAIVPIREIGARYREQVARHLLALPPQDRYLRFGYAANDQQIQQYVDKLDFSRDQLFGIFNRKLELIAMAHLAYPVEMTEAGFAEFGVSVAAHARGRGYGSRLFERAAIHAVNDGVKTLYIHALSENTAMLRIARNAGAEVERHGSESEAHLTLPEASFSSRLGELFADQVGQVDYWLKAEVSRARGMLATVQEVRGAVREGRHKSGS